MNDERMRLILEVVIALAVIWWFFHEFSPASVSSAGGGCGCGGSCGGSGGGTAAALGLLPNGCRGGQATTVSAPVQVTLPGGFEGGAPPPMVPIQPPVRVRSSGGFLSETNFSPNAPSATVG